MHRLREKLEQGQREQSERNRKYQEEISKAAEFNTPGGGDGHRKGNRRNHWKELEELGLPKRLDFETPPNSPSSPGSPTPRSPRFRFT